MSDDEQTPQINFESIEVKNSEIGFVTSIDIATRTFFAQLCRNPNDELVKFNQATYAYCEKVIHDEELKKKLPKVHTASVVCAKFSQDGYWYRAIVLSKNKEQKTCKLLFIDYGNVEETSMDSVIVPLKSDLPGIERDPFGITCFMEDSDTYSSDHAAKFLRCLLNNYILFKSRGKMTKVQWRVHIPMHAYNIPFWISFKPVDEAAKAERSATSIKV